MGCAVLSSRLHVMVITFWTLFKGENLTVHLIMIIFCFEQSSVKINDFSISVKMEVNKYSDLKQI